MIVILPVHRRLAELNAKARELGDWSKLSCKEQTEIRHCMEVNEVMIAKIEFYNQLCLHAYEMDDMDWVHEVCRKKEELIKPMNVF